MVGGILGKKIGMTQVFDDQGRAVPVTVVQAGPCVVVQRKTTDTDGYEAVQLGLIEPDRPFKVRQHKPDSGWRGREKGGRRISWAMLKHFEKAGIPPVRFVAEVPVEAGDEIEAGESVLADIFQPDDKVHVVGRSKGRGFQGVIKRHGFGGGRATHGSMFHRAPGSIGMAAYPARVLKGMGMPGQTGNKRVTVRNVEVVRVLQTDDGRDLLLLKGGIPGARNSYIRLLKVS